MVGRFVRPLPQTTLVELQVSVGVEADTAELHLAVAIAAVFQVTVPEMQDAPWNDAQFGSDEIARAKRPAEEMIGIGARAAKRMKHARGILHSGGESVGHDMIAA